MKTKSILSYLLAFSIYMIGNQGCKKDNNEPLNEVPSAPVNPVPYNGAAAQALNVTLKWNKVLDPENDAITYDIYFGTTNTPPLVKTGHIDTTYQVTGLARLTGYFWKVIAKDSHGNATSGTNWYFVTASNSPIVFNPSLTYGTLTDSRDGKVYKTIEISGKTWMAQNLDYDDGTSWYYNDDTSTALFGRLYTWHAANSVCPTGWHLPSFDEWQSLVDTLGGYTIAGGKLKETDTLHWKSPNAGADNSTGFTALPNGMKNVYSNTYSGNGTNANFWSSSKTMTDASQFMTMNSATANGYIMAYTPKVHGLSVRCIKD